MMIFRFVLVYLIIGCLVMYSLFNLFEEVCRDYISKDVRFRMREGMQWFLYIGAMVILVLTWPTLVPGIVKKIFKRGEKNE